MNIKLQMVRAFENQISAIDSEILDLELSPIKMQISEYSEWFDIIIKDDVVAATEFLRDKPETEKSHLLNGCCFDYDIPVSIEENKEKLNVVEKCLTRVNMPFHIAISFCSKEIAGLFLENDADVLQRNEYGNVLHAGITVAFAQLMSQVEISKMIKWLIGQLDLRTVKALLLQENTDGLRPLEYAAQQGCLHLMNLILEIKGQTENETSCALILYELHDVTEYELGDRYYKSPLKMIANLDKSLLNDPESCHVLSNPAISKWIQCKISSNVIPIIILFLLRLCPILLSMVLTVNVDDFLDSHVNSTETFRNCQALMHIQWEGGTSFWLHIKIMLILLCHMVIRILGDLIPHYRKQNHFQYNLKGKKKVLSSTPFYRTVFMILAFLVTLVSFITTTKLYQIYEPVQIFRNIAINITPILCLFTICNFLQLIDFLGPSVISIQGLVIDVSEFMLLYLLVMVPFIFIFQLLVFYYSKQGCVESFSSVFMTSYTLFRMMINQFDVTTVEMRSPHENAVLYMLHVLYIVMVAIMLLNFLIAMMSNSASKISQHQKLILKVNQLSLVIMVEDLMQLFAKKAKKYFKRGFHRREGGIYLKYIECRYSRLLIDEPDDDNCCSEVSSSICTSV